MGYFREALHTYLHTDDDVGARGLPGDEEI